MAACLTKTEVGDSVFIRIMELSFGAAKGSFRFLLDSLKKQED
jgi:hypothetical protein